MDDWRVILYPLGFLSSIAFGIRFLVQWLQSEQAHKSIVSPLFWKISLIGNLLLLIHSFIQVQIHVCAIQACNAVISWRNLNLMQTNRPPVSFPTVIFLFCCALFFTIVSFAAQDWILTQKGDWFRIPIAPWQTSMQTSTSFFWHLLGSIAYFLFSSRFWIQWWLAEKSHESILPLSFWWLSLIGALLSICYFIHIGDSVNLIGLLFGIIPYIRNIMMIYTTKSAEQQP